MAVEIFYRVLDDAPNDDGTVNPQSTLRRWRDCEYNSTHNAIPPDWINAWNANSRTYSQFELLCKDGFHTIESLRIFISGATAVAVGANPLTQQSQIGSPIHIGELDGTCAFKTLNAAWQYMLGDPANPSSLIKVQMSWIVQFRGIDLGVEIPENKGGGVQVKVVHPGTPAGAVHYANEYNLPLPPEEGTGDIDLPFEGQ